MNIQNVNHLVHAYKVAPWRVNRQWFGTAFLVVLSLAMIAAIYLDVTSKAAIAGREIQELTAAMTVSRQMSGDLQTQLASLTSASVMQTRALELGFRPLKAGEAEYLSVPGYVTLEPEILSSAAVPQLSALSRPREYSESLLEWMDEKIAATSRGLR